ncbi:MAG: hypothetical protein HY000_35700 [Planctomycetes bacterium]|nr:hypothetical protein [Planctomycetota bacterium]
MLSIERAFALNSMSSDLRQRVRWFLGVLLLLGCSAALAESFVFLPIAPLIMSLRTSAAVGAGATILLTLGVVFFYSLRRRARSQRRFQFTLSTMLVTVLALSWPMARVSNEFHYEVHRAHAQQAAIAKLKELNAKDVQMTGRENLKGLRSLGLVLIARWINDNEDTLYRLADVIVVDLSGTGASDEQLSVLAELNNIQELNLSGTQLTDSGLASLLGLTNLRKLSVKNTRVTEQGLKRLRLRLPDTLIEF